MSMRWNYPCDPGCPGFVKLQDDLSVAMDDPMTTHYGVGSDLAEDYEMNKFPRHRAGCPRCQEYGAANAEVV